MDDRTSRLRIAVVAPPFYEVPPVAYGGTERVCHALVEGLVDRGHDVTLICAGTPRTRARAILTFVDPQPEGTEAEVAIEVEHAARAARAVGDLQPDVVHDHTRAGALTAIGRSAPTVLTVHNAMAGADAFPGGLAACSGWLSPVAVSHAQRRSAPWLPWSATVHNGLLLDAYRYRRSKEDFVLFLGRLSRHKGVEAAIQAARRADRNIVIAGSCTTPAEAVYLEHQLRPQFGRGVEWVGEVGGEQKADLLSRAACLLFPSQWHEPFGLVLVEALASGTPVVALRAGAVEEIVVHGRTGFVCECEDDLVPAIDAVQSLDAASCRSDAAMRFSAARMAVAYEEVYLAALDSPMAARAAGVAQGR